MFFRLPGWEGLVSAGKWQTAEISKLGQTVKGAMSRGRELDKGVGEYRQLDRQNISAFSTSLSTSLGLRAGHVQQVKI